MPSSACSTSDSNARVPLHHPTVVFLEPRGLFPLLPWVCFSNRSCPTLDLTSGLYPIRSACFFSVELIDICHLPFVLSYCLALQHLTRSHRNPEACLLFSLLCPLRIEQCLAHSMCNRYLTQHCITMSRILFLLPHLQAHGFGETFVIFSRLLEEFTQHALETRFL